MNGIIIPFAAFVISIGIFFTYVQPTWNGPIAKAKQLIAADDQALVASKQYITQQNQLASARDAIDPANLAALSAFLPSSVDNVGLIIDLNALATRSGLSVSNIDVVNGSELKSNTDKGVQIAAAKDPIGSVTLTFAAVGSFTAFNSFLSGVEKSARLLDVQDLTVRGSDTGVYSYQMTLRLYWLR